MFRCCCFLIVELCVSLATFAQGSAESKLSPVEMSEKYYRTGLYDSSISILYELLKSGDVDSATAAESYILLGNSYLRLQKDNTALVYLDKAQDVISELKQTLPYDTFSSLCCRLNIAFSSVYIQKCDFKKASSYLEAAKRVCNGDPTLTGRIYQNEAMIFENTGNLAQAESFARKALVLADDDYARAIIQNNLAVIYARQERYADALSLLDENEKIVSEIDALHIKSNIYVIKSRIQAMTGDYRKAYESRLKSELLTDSIFNKRREEKILQENVAYETLKIENEKKMAEYELQIARLKNMRNLVTLILAVCLLIPLVILTVRKILRQKAANRNLEEKISTFNETEDQYKTEIDVRTRKLMANVVYTTEIREASQQVIKDMEHLEDIASDDSVRTVIKDLREHIRPLTAESLGWNDFKIYFEQTHPSFFAELYKAFPTLTSLENRMCAFIVMNLSTKEIAQLTNRSIRTVETMKFRLRKKMEIPHGQSILSFLQRFLVSSTENQETT